MFKELILLFSMFVIVLSDTDPINGCYEKGCCAPSTYISYKYNKKLSKSCKDAIPGGFPITMNSCEDDNCCLINHVCVDGDIYGEFCSRGYCNKYGCECKEKCASDKNLTQRQNFRLRWPKAIYLGPAL